MFSLAIIKDTIAIHPSNFGVPQEEALTAELNRKYANRVLFDVGLCMCVFDIAEAGEGKVRYGDGLLWYKVTFRLVVFRPFTSEVILAKVKSSDEDGIRATVGFFDDIYIPLAYLPQPSAFDPQERSHFWIADPDTAAAHSSLLDIPTADRMYIDTGEVLRIRVEADEFVDEEPGPPKAAEGVRVERVAMRAPYAITCSIAEQGLGPVSWWSGGDGDAEGEVMDEG